MSDSDPYNQIPEQRSWNAFMTASDAEQGLKHKTKGLRVYIISEDQFYYWKSDAVGFIPEAQTSGSGAIPAVDEFSDLPDPSSSPQEVYIVKNTTGTIGTRNLSGLWKTTGSEWVRLSNDTSSNTGERNATDMSYQPDVTSDWSPVPDTAKQALDQVANILTSHVNNTSNPHSVTKTQIGLGLVQNVKNNLNGSGPPMTNDDSSQNYTNGSMWVDVNNEEAYVLVDDSIGNALWEPISANEADEVLYDNSGNLLSATTTQDAIDQLADLADGFMFTQGTPSTTWSVNHNMGKFPSVTVVDSADSVVVGSVQYVDQDNVTIEFSSPFSGKAYLN